MRFCTAQCPCWAILYRKDGTLYRNCNNSSRGKKIKKHTRNSVMGGNGRIFSPLFLTKSKRVSFDEFKPPHVICWPWQPKTECSTTPRYDGSMVVMKGIHLKQYIQCFPLIKKSNPYQTGKPQTYTWEKEEDHGNGQGRTIRTTSYSFSHHVQYSIWMQFPLYLPQDCLWLLGFSAFYCEHLSMAIFGEWHFINATTNQPRGLSIKLLCGIFWKLWPHSFLFLALRGWL